MKPCISWFELDKGYQRRKEFRNLVIYSAFVIGTVLCGFALLLLVSWKIALGVLLIFWGNNAIFGKRGSR